MARPRFTVDHMLLKLGRYLRCVGYDAVWDEDVPSQRLLDRASREHRVFLTRSSRLQDEDPEPRELYRVRSQDPVMQLHEVARVLELDLAHHLFTRCVRCNVKLDAVTDLGPWRGLVPEHVLQRYHEFTTCPSCGTLFWRGTHVTNTCRKLELPDAAEV